MGNAIVLCSGGMDSVVCAHKIKGDYDKISVLFFDYGQKTVNVEREMSENCAKEISADFIEIKLHELAKLSDSLINKEGEINELSVEDLKDTTEESKKWYVPCRNTLFLSYALALAESKFVNEGVKNDIFVGFKCEGNDSYPDTTKEFVESVNNLARVGCSTNFELKAPLIEMDKEDIIELGVKLGLDLSKTHSCYVGLEEHCGKCLSCKLRQQGFKWANIKDNTKYANA